MVFGILQWPVCVCRVPPKGHCGPAGVSLALFPPPPRLCAFYIPPSAAASAIPQMPSLLCARRESPLHGSSTDLWDSGCGPPAGPHRGPLLVAIGLPWTVQVPRLSQQGEGGLHVEPGPQTPKGPELLFCTRAGAGVRFIQR